MRIRRSSVLALAVGSFIAVSSPAPASLFAPVRDRQLVCEAADIVRGRVTSVHSAWDEENVAIWTMATVDVDAVMRGGMQAGARATIREVGGTAGGYTIHAEGFPTFREGEEVVLLLRPWGDPSGAHRVWGYGRGMFRVDRKDTRGPTATRYDVMESGRPTMAVDRIPPVVVLEALERDLSTLSGGCAQGDLR